jgi:hypothetical protein
VLASPHPLFVSQSKIFSPRKHVVKPAILISKRRFTLLKSSHFIILLALIKPLGKNNAPVVKRQHIEQCGGVNNDGGVSEPACHQRQEINCRVSTNLIQTLKTRRQSALM